MAADTTVTFTPQTPPGVVLTHFRPWLTIAHQVPGRLRQTLRTILDEAHEQLRHAAS